MRDGQGDIAGNSTLRQLQAVLREQVNLASRGEYDRLGELAETVERLLAELAAQGAAGQDPEGLKESDSLHRQLCLALAIEKGDIAERLAKMRHGRTSLRAYGQASKL